mgnify:CR=1 FL=1
MASITTRAGKGSPLTNAEVDANFANLNADKLERNGSNSMTGPLGLGVTRLTTFEVYLATFSDYERQTSSAVKYGLNTSCAAAATCCCTAPA